MKKYLIVLIGAALAAVTTAQAKVSEQTLTNLNTAFQGESNAANRYAIFAKKAEADGDAFAAHVFRAASQAESIHKESHKKAILDLGGTVADFQLEEVVPGTTAENLKASIKGESYERDTMYPEFLAQARKDGAKEAVRTFLYAQKAEAEHAKLYQLALEKLGQDFNEPLYVCKVCGYTVSELPSGRCPSCREPVSNYMRID